MIQFDKNFKIWTNQKWTLCVYYQGPIAKLRTDRDQTPPLSKRVSNRGGKITIVFIDHWSIYLQSFGLVGWAVGEITLVVDWKMLSIVSDDLRSQCGTAVAQPTQAALHSVPDRCVQSVQCVVSICHPEFICCRLQSVTFVLCVRQDNQRIKITRKESSKWIFYTLKWRPFIWWINYIFFPRDSGWFQKIFRLILF